MKFMLVYKHYAPILYNFIFTLLVTLNLPLQALGMETCKQFIQERKQAYYTKQLFRAVKKRNPKKAVELITRFPNLVYVRDNMGNTPLHLVKSGFADRELATLFLENGALVNTTNALGETALHCIAKDAWPEDLMELVLEHGADVHARTKEGDTALHVAARSNVKSVDLLLEMGADPDMQNGKGQTPLHLVFIDNPGSSMDYWMGSKELYDVRKRIETLLEAGARIDIVDVGGQPPAQAQHPYIKKHIYTKLFAAILEEDDTLLLRLLKQGADPNVNVRQLELLNDTHSTDFLLNVAMFEYNENAVRHLLDFGADPCKRPNIIETPVNLIPQSIVRKACDFGCPQMAQIMLTHIPLHRYRRLWNSILVPLAQCKQFKMLPADLRRLIILTYCLKNRIIREQYFAALSICENAQLVGEQDKYMFNAGSCEQYVPHWLKHVAVTLYKKDITYRCLSGMHN